MTKNSKRLLITGGGTGGHIFPGLAVAHYLIKEYGWKVYWLGSIGHLEADIVPKNGIQINFIHAIGFCGKSWYKQLISLLFFCFSVLKARSIIRFWKPDIILGVGGYVSAPVGVAAWFCGCPVIVHEQNSVAGLANRFLAMTVAKKVLQAFPNAFSYAETVGNPIRDVILDIKDPEDRLCNRVGPVRLLIIGGSQGAQIFNHMMPRILSVVINQFIIWHQVGKGNIQEVYHFYSDLVKQDVYKIIEFIDDIAFAYEWADIVICRSGALTVSEISSVGVPAIFVPFAHRDCHQYLNALPLQQIGAAKIISEQEFTVNHVSYILHTWSDRSLLLKMAKRAKILSIPDSTEQIAYRIRSLLIR
ncbi:undecaprenyldiphospho-muramoylpentapeptide beta-N-acetylglucosaminyltransferase [Blochmannia endosymbiont of Polyrhachis (Hedomyrma) turneri]|uniref:undecaprenyldiphospho-muramoylpentapeptide beta-N-acetylglucosaminyltransferase n=1 Tax=Blochmannia endosymbiont of Polyrhachis (Hedomyrma) turneri TaxID=1505596 RepID=UPI00061A8771|nr:undecaprenyldiphospho-muramoylpentapeptide beta-N-acetylglucosaminyltransferase [Blochmannia endosymbiont of Polyrhachis (Hedomyrma) turneri]AKC59725.1 UDP-N-acetylglucosamine--N-acetylmuramyl-(pentapeptide) pyrophosphoryl-undecaprenol N-acetylglucosamine transferase [Blochmannia endosymbiont of Polyrhachis (Hedomyrma) turneri]